MNRNLFDEINQQLSRLSPRIGALNESAREQVAAAVQKALVRMDLPTREEFDRQRQALEQAQARIAELEETVGRLEQSSREQ